MTASPAGGLKGNLGFLLFPGFTVLDLYGPLEFLSNLAKHGHEVNVLTVAEEAGPVASSQGPETVAEYSFKDCPPLEVLVVPGGIGTRAAVTNKVLLEWVKSRYQSQAPPLKYLLSICTGAGIVARAGLLDDRKATSHKASFQWLGEQSAKVDWARNSRWVVDGNIWSSAGVSAGMDMTLAFVRAVFGEDTAARLANAAEYEGNYRDPNREPPGTPS